MSYQNMSPSVTVRLLYELKTLNEENIVVVYKPEGVTHPKEKYPNTPIYSIREIEALEGLETVEQSSQKNYLTNIIQKGR